MRSRSEPSRPLRAQQCRSGRRFAVVRPHSAGESHNREGGRLFRTEL